MEREEIHFRCPLCGQTFFAKNMKHHVKRSHPETKPQQFLTILRKANESGQPVIKRKRIELKGVTASPKTAFSEGALETTRYVSFVSGGAVGLGKKR